MTLATCGPVNARTLGFDTSCAIPVGKGTLPKGMFAAKVPISAKTKQHLLHDVEQITMLALLRAENTGLDASATMPEILVLGLKLAPGVKQVPQDIVELIAGQRKSGILFVAVRESQDTTHHDGEATLCVRRGHAARAGHAPVYTVYTGSWQDAKSLHVQLNGTTMAQLWDSLSSQVILDDDDWNDLDARIARASRIAELNQTIAKLTADHQRAKTGTQRNEIYAKLHKAKQELEALRA